MKVNLSYFLSEDSPIYGGVDNVSIKEDGVISKGDSANTKLLQLSNHSGTHIDYPNHFIDEGKKSDTYPAEFWFFDNPYMIKIEANDEELIDLTKEELSTIPLKTDFLIINTGYWKYRNEKKYWNNNPGISPKLAKKLKEQFSKLRVLGVDLISITSYQHRSVGRVAHKVLLSEPSILLIEDLDLSGLHSIPDKIIALPTLLKSVDGAPIHVVAEIEEE